MKLPVAFEEKMKRLLKDEYEAYLASYKLPKYQGLRVNTLKLSLEEWEKINPFTSLKTPISKYSHILRYWGVRTSTDEFWGVLGHNSAYNTHFKSHP